MYGRFWSSRNEYKSGAENSVPLFCVWVWICMGSAEPGMDPPQDHVERLMPHLLVGMGAHLSNFCLNAL